MMKKVAVLGAGNGGVAMAAHITLMGAKVNLYDKFPQALKEIQLEGGIHLQEGETVRFAKLELVTTELKEALSGCSLVMIVAPAFAHAELAHACKPHLEEGTTIVLNPGRTGGALEFYQIVKERVKVNVAEAQTLIYACRRDQKTGVTIFGTKKKVSLATIPQKNSDEVLNQINEYYPQFQKAKNVLETSLLNIGAIFHPVPTLLNMARIEAKEEYQHYIDGISPAVAIILQTIDDERVQIAKAMGVETITTCQWLNEVYNIKESSLYQMIQDNHVYHGISAPKTLDVRYITEDVPTSLVPLSELAKIVQVKTPVIDHFIDIASLIHKKDYRKEGRDLKRLGLDNKNLDEMMQYIEKG